MKNIFTFVCAAMFSFYAFAEETNEQVANEGTEAVAANTDEGCGCGKPDKPKDNEPAN